MKMITYTREQIEKELGLLKAQMEKVAAMRVNISFTCIKCNKTITDVYDSIIHSHKCQLPASYNKEKPKFEQPPKEPYRLY